MTERTENPDAGPKLLSGGNPQIPKGEGDGPVQAYIEAMPGWKRGLGERLDRLVVQTGVQFRGTSLDPVPPKASSHPEVRDLDIREDDDVDEAQLIAWIEQAASLPGERL